MKPIAAVILAAGKGTRMKSALPKVLHRACGVPMVELVVRAVKQAGVSRPVIVVGHEGEQVIEQLGDGNDYVWQREQRGTGHAALMAREALAQHDGPVLITAGDTPLLTGDALSALLADHVDSGAAVTVGTAVLDDAGSYGRILRDADGSLEGIVEARDAQPDVLAIREVNSGIYCFDAKLLFAVLPTLTTDNDQGEYYLTDAIAALRSQGHVARAFLFGDPKVMLGVNDRWELAEAGELLRLRTLRDLALSGVTLVDPKTTYISPGVQIGRDTVIEPMCVLEGDTWVGADCSVGPGCRLVDTRVGDRCTIVYSQLNRAVLHDDVRCGPYANLRPKAVLGKGAKVGNFVEVKAATLGEKAAASHLAYIGDGEVGDGANIGAGTIFCNYDGYNKSRTVVGGGAFVGSNSTLVAPVNIGEGAFVAAGSVITSDVPADALAIGRGRQEVKPEWALKWRQRKTESG